MKNSKSKILSLLLAIVMLLSNISPVFAASDKKSNSFDVSTILDNAEVKAQLSKLATSNNPQDKKEADKKVRVVVELKTAPLIDYATSKGAFVKELSVNEVNNYEAKLFSEQQRAKEVIANKGIETFVTGDDNKVSDFAYTTVINGFSTYVKASDLEKLESLDEVKNVYIVNEYNRPAEAPLMSTSNDMVASPTAWNLGYKGEGMVVAVLDSGYDIEHQDFNISPETQVELTPQKADFLIKSNNLPGKYYTPKYPYAYNYYDKTHHIKNPGSNHGQHVAGTIAANGKIKGVAPEAQLLGMKVFSDDPLYATTFSDIYVKAIDDSVKLGADALNMSLGSPAGNYIFGSIEDVAIANARENGVVVAISAGNEHSIIDGIANFRNNLTTGIPYPFSKNPDTAVLGTPSLFEGDMSVASINNTHIQARVFEYTVNGEAAEAQLSVASGAPLPWEVLKGTYSASDIVVIRKETITNGATPGTAASFEGKDVKDKIVFVERGNTFTDTIVNAQDRGAKAVVIFNNVRPNNDDALINMAGGDLANIPFFMISRATAEKILADPANTTISFPDKTASFEDNENGGRISDFSSIGPSPELTIKPEISAPGGNIYSTDNDDSYVTMSGTSMAAPHVSGGAALVHQRILKDKHIFGDLDKKERGRLAKILLMNTAVPAIDKYGETYLVRQQGAGLMNLEGATTTDVYVVEDTKGEAKAEIGSFTSSQITISLTAYNRSNENRRFNVSANALTDHRQEASGYEFLTENPITIQGTTVYGGGNILIPANGKKQVKLTIDLSKAIASGELKENSFVEGFVSFKSLENKPNLTVPYLGFYGDYESLNVLDEPYTNLFDNDKSNDPMFTSTRLNYVQDGSVTGPVGTHTPVYINPTETGYNNKGVVLTTTALRNFNRIEYSIEDKDGNILLNLGQTQGGRKITRMGRGTAPYQTLQEGLWDGKINGKPLAEGQSVYYTVRAFFRADSKPQVMRFEVAADHSVPEITDYEGYWRGKRAKMSNEEAYNDEIKGLDAKLKYNPQTREITFKARDDKAGTGINAISLVNLATVGTPSVEYISWAGDANLEKIRVAGDRYHGEYKIKVPEGKFKSSLLGVYVEDKAANTVVGVVRVEDLTQSSGLQKPEILSFNENTRIVRAKVKPGAVLVISKDPTMSNPQLVAFGQDDDFDGVVEVDLGHLTFGPGQPALAMSIIYLEGQALPEFSEPEVLFPIPAAADTTKPLAPKVNEVILKTADDTVNVITGRAYEKDMIIEAKLNGELIGTATSDKDGKFEIKLTKAIKADDEVEVTAKRAGTELVSDPVKLGVGTLKQPVVDNGVILPGQEVLYGDAFIGGADVILERDPQTDEEEQLGKKIEFARVKSDDKGRFAVNPLNLEANKLKLGDKIYIHSEKDGQTSPIAEYTIGEDPRLMPTGEDLTMFIHSPGLTSGYRGEVPFRITMFGWDNIDKLTFGDIELEVKENNYYRVNHPQTGQPVFYGKVFTVDQKLNLEEGYYDDPIIAYDTANNREFGLTRRFWVDKTKPTVKVAESNKEVKAETTADGKVVYTVKTSANEVNVNIIVDDNGPDLSLFRGDTLIGQHDITDAKGYELNPSTLSFNENIKLGNENEVSYDYEAYDIARNKVAFTIKVVKETAPEKDLGRKPRIVANDRTVYVGETIDLYQGIKAYDFRGNDITGKIKVKPRTIDTSKPGTHTVKYEVIDVDQNYNFLEVTVTVKNRKEASVDTSRLAARIEEAKRYEGQKYTLNSFQDLTQALADAEYQIKSVSLTDEIVEELIERLDKAIAGLVRIDKLEEVYSYAKDEVEYGQADFTAGSYQALKEAVDNAARVLANPAASQEEVDAALDALNAAIKGLTRIPNKEMLVELYNNLIAEIDAGTINADKYTVESYNALVEALNRALAVIENENAGQEEVDSAYQALMDALGNLVEVEKDPVDPVDPEDPEDPENPDPVDPVEEEVNKDKLRILYNQAFSTDQSKLDRAGRRQLNAALQYAHEVLTNPDASQAEIEQAYNDLKAALAGAKPETNKKLLEAQIKQYEDLNRDLYTAESYRVYEEALNRAKALVADQNAKQADVDNALKALIEAHDALVLKPVDKSELTAAIKEAKELSQTNLTAETKEKLEKAIAKAEEVNNNKDATAEDVKKATEDLKAAIKVAKEAEKPNDQPKTLREVLQELVDEGNSKVNDEKYPYNARRNLKSAIRNAQRLLDSPSKVTDREYQQQIDRLKEALALLK